MEDYYVWETQGTDGQPDLIQDTIGVRRQKALGIEKGA
jgi:hypothetical protein